MHTYMQTAQHLVRGVGADLAPHVGEARLHRRARARVAELERVQARVQVGVTVAVDLRDGWCTDSCVFQSPSPRSIPRTRTTGNEGAGQEKDQRARSQRTQT